MSHAHAEKFLTPLLWLLQPPLDTCQHLFKIATTSGSDCSLQGERIIMTRLH